jgi:ketosteroid isomerase-like protein
MIKNLIYMNWKIFYAAFAIVAVSSCDSSFRKHAGSEENDYVKINELLENYKRSINNADTVLAKTFWHTSSDVSFIHPNGHEKGWEGIKKGIYEMFGTRFTTRDLKSYDETITLYGDMAILEFYWVFDAILAGDNPVPIQTKGRETQVLKKFGETWRIVHIHYSGMPESRE